MIALNIVCHMCFIFFFPLYLRLHFFTKTTLIFKFAALTNSSTSYFSCFFSWKRFHSTARWEWLASSMHHIIAYLFFLVCSFAVIIFIHIAVLLLRSYLTCADFIFIFQISSTISMYNLLFWLAHCQNINSVVFVPLFLQGQTQFFFHCFKNCWVLCLFLREVASCLFLTDIALINQCLIVM